MDIPASSSTQPLLSVIIPARNDAAVITRCLTSLLNEPGQFEIIVVDGESEDGSILAASAFPEVKIISSTPGRARQMNAGTRVAYGSTFLFLNPDCILPPGWYQEILRFESGPEYSCGMFPVAFDSVRLRFRILASLINGKNRLLKSSFGSQGVLVRRPIFKEVSGFREWPMFSRVNLFRRLGKRGKIYLASKHVTASTSPWEREGILRKCMRTSGYLLLYKLGIPVNRIAQLDPGHPLITAVFSEIPSVDIMNWNANRESGANQSQPRRHTLLVHTYNEAVKSGISTYLYHSREQCDRRFHNLLGLETRCRDLASGQIGRKLECVFRDLVGATDTPAMIALALCPHIRAEHFKHAGDALKTHDAVIGKTNRGGFYLVGLRRYSSGLLDHITWNTENTADEFIKRLQTFNYAVAHLPVLDEATNDNAHPPA